MKICDKNVEAVSGYFLNNASLITKVLEVLVPNFSNELYKFVDDDSTVFLFDKLLENGDFQFKCNDNIRIVKKENIITEIFNIFNSTDLCLKSHKFVNPSGILMSSKFYLFLTIICEIFNTKEKLLDAIDLYHFSGTQMINYMIKNKQMAFENKIFFEKAYKLVCEKFKDSLPKQVNFNLIPTDYFRFICCLKSCDYNKLEEIYKLYKMIQNLKNVKNRIKSDFIEIEFNKLKELDNLELLRFVNETIENISKRKANKLNYLFSKCDIKREKIVSELANLLYQNNKLATDIICLIDSIINEFDLDFKNKVSENLNLFFEEITQYDLLFSNDDIYIAKQSYNMKINEIKKISKIILSIKNCG